MTGDEGPTINQPSDADPDHPQGSGRTPPDPSFDDAQTLDAPSDAGGESRPAVSTVRIDPSQRDEMLEGAELGPYRVRRVLGEGGFGVVYLAEQTHPVRRQVAVKVIKPGMDTHAVVARFEAERQALAVMDHPCIASVFDAGQTPKGRPFFVMEFVKGVPLTEFAAKQRLNLEARIKLFQRVCEAVQHAHSKGVIHRDLKPSNILVEYEDGHASPKIIDFGVAKAINQRLTEKTIFTEQGQILGTPEYMSPEQAEMSGLDIDTRTDVYALGVVLYELLTGQLPFDAKSLRSAGYAEIQRIIREVDPPRPSTKLSTVGAQRPEIVDRDARERAMDSKDLTKRLRRDLDWVVMKCLEKNRERRYPTATSLSAELERYLKFEPVEAGPPSMAYRFAKFARRRRGVLTSASLVALALVLGVVGLWIGLSREAAAHREAANRAAEAEQLAGFTTSILTGIDPEVAGGYDTTLLKQIFVDADARIDDEVTRRPRVEGSIRTALGKAYNAIASPEDATRQLRAAVELRTDELGADHPETRDARAALAEALWDAGKFDEAERLYQDLIEGAEPESREALSLRTDLGGVLAVQADPKAAEGGALLNETLATQQLKLGDGAPDAIRTMLLLSSYEQDAGRHDRAIELATSAARVRRERHGADHPLTLFAEHRVATATLQSGDTEAALPLLRGALEQQRRILGERHSTTLGTMQALGVALRRSGDPAGALEYLRPVVDLHVQKFGNAHTETYIALMSAGRAGMESGAHADAERWFAGAVESAKSAEGAQPFYEGYARGSQGLALLELDRTNDAERALLEAHDKLNETLGADHALSRTVADGLARLYESVGRAAEAGVWRERSGAE